MTKPPLTDEEYAVVMKILAAGDALAQTKPGAAGRWRPRGMGLRAAAAAVNRLRGVDRLLDHAAQRRRAVSVRWLTDQLARRRALEASVGNSSDRAESGADQVAAGGEGPDPEHA